MKHCLGTIFCIAIVGFFSSLFGVGRSLLITDNYSQYIDTEVHDLASTATIMLDQYVFTFDPMRQVLAQEVKEGAFVSISMNRAHASNPPTYYFFEDLAKELSPEAKTRLQINKYPGKYILHAKHLSWQEKGHCASHIGSYNLTNLAADANKELMVATYDDPVHFQECKEFHDAVVHLCSQVYEQNSAYIASLQRQALEGIPGRRMVITSLKHDINGSLISCMQDLKKGGKAFVGTYSMNDPKFVQALCDAADRGAQIQFFLDGQTVDTKTERRLLKQLHDHGIIIYIYNYDGSKKYGKYSCKMHAKFYAAKQEGIATLVVISTQNFTRQFALNMASLHPNDEVLFNNLSTWCQKLAYECDTYENLGLMQLQ